MRRERAEARGAGVVWGAGAGDGEKRRSSCGSAEELLVEAGVVGRAGLDLSQRSARDLGGGVSLLPAMGMSISSCQLRRTCDEVGDELGRRRY